MTPLELEILTFHGKEHPDLQSWIQEQNWSAIANWYDDNSKPTITKLVKYLSLQDQANFFSYINFQDWYKQYCEKLIVNDIYLIFNYTPEQIKDCANQLLIGLIEYKLLSLSFQNLIFECFRRELDDLLMLFLIALGANRIFEPYTMLLYQVEFANVKRWEALNLSAPPTPFECEYCFT